MLIPVILAGGVGSRLWPLSREQYPKQFIPLVDEKQSLMQLTLNRLQGLADVQPPILVCSEAHRFLVAEQVRHFELSGHSIILEPQPCNTAPAVALAAFEALARFKDPVLLVLPADHLISDVEGFHRTIQVGLEPARKGKLVTFGVTPTCAETGYGYIRRKKSLRKSNYYAIDSFTEKPDEKTAKQYIESGGYYWNSGMFMFTAGAYLEELKAHAADIFDVCEQAFRTIDKDMDFERISADVFSACRSDSIDYAVMEKTSNATVVPLQSDWNDVGAWAAVADVMPADEGGNVTQGDVRLASSKNSYVRSESRLVSAIGIDNMVVIETPDAVLVADKDSVQEVKGIVEVLKQEGRHEATNHTCVYRPWGSYEAIVNAPRFQAKRIVVNPGAALSLQLHHHRAEHWIVVKGCGKVTRGEDVFHLNEDESTYIPIGTKHRLENPGIIPLEIIEVQTGSYLGEDDIVRLEDVYGRLV